MGVKYMEEKTESIYVVLIKARTGLGTISRAITKYKYTHIAISFDAALTDFISFSRRNHYMPLDAGMMHEYRSCYAFGDKDKFEAKVFKLPITKQEFKHIHNITAKMEADPEYMFNLFSMLTMPLLHGFPVYKAYNCMSFVGLILKNTSCVTLDKPYYKYMIAEFDELLKDYFYYEGFLKKDTKVLEHYMCKPKISTKIKISTTTIVKLFYRMFFQRRKKLK